MTNGDTGLSAPRGTDVPRLNLQLLRVLLRAPLLGSPLFLEEEDRLVHLLLRDLRRLVEGRPLLCRRHDPEALATDVCCGLIPMWRNGVPFWFTHTYLRHLLRRRLGEERTPRLTSEAELEAVTDRHPEEAGRDEEVRRMLHLADEFRDGLDPVHRDLFDDWVRHDGRPGWKIDHARRTGRSPTWVTNHLNRLRRMLVQQHGLSHPDEFIEVVQFFRPAQDAGEPAAQPPEPPARPQAEPPAERAPRVDLAEAFTGQPPLQRLVGLYGHPLGQSEDDIGAQLFGDDDPRPRLEALLADGRERYLAWARDVGRPRVKAWKFYRRIASGRASVATLLGRGEWTDEQQDRARELAARARPSPQRPTPVAFEKLPDSLGLPRRAVDELLLRLRAAAYRPDRPRRGRGPARPLPGG
jgi:hypothetical protein